MKNKVEFKHGLFDCCKLNCKTCCYVTCCHCCGIADLSILIDGCCVDNLTIRWWLVIFAYFLPIQHFVIIYIAWAASQQIADKLGFYFDTCSCCCLLQYCFCWPCKVCQIANQLGADKQGIQCPETVELVTKINRHVPFKNMLARVINNEKEVLTPQMSTQPSPHTILV